MALIRGREKKAAAQIFTASMADIVFLLLVFFIVTYKVSTDEEIVTFASTEVARDPNKEFIIKADEAVPYERVDAVLDALKQSKAKYIFLLSDQQTVNE